MELKYFQREAIAQLNEAMGKAERDVVLKSPTGSGKTIILTSFMDEYMRSNPDIVFVWLTPGQGELHEQSKTKMERYCHGARTKNLADVMTSGFAAGDAVFINWQKLTMRGNLALKDSERTNFLEWIQKAFDAKLRFKVIIDESHANFTDKADAVISYFKTDKIIRASATPKPNPQAIWIEIREEDVIAEGLIKKMIQINPDFPVGKKLVDKDEVAFLLEQAEAKRQELRQRFAMRKVKVNPLIVVQLPNNSDLQLSEVEAWFNQRGINAENGTFAVWLANRKDNLESISENNAKQEVVVIKQAIATGWDCPRAHILVKLRKNMGETFEIQTIGRIRRMPEAEHYGDTALDCCYLYTLDDKFVDGENGVGGLRQALNGQAINAMKLFLKPEHRDFSLVCEQRTMVVDTRDPIMALTSSYAHFARKYKLGDDQIKNRMHLETGGYLFGTDIINRTVSGDASVLQDVFNGGKLDKISFATVLNTHRHGPYFRHAIGEIGAACGMQYDDIRITFMRLFCKKYDSEKKFVSLTTNEVYAFAINNMRQLKEDFRAAMAEDLPIAAKADPISEKTFRFPREWVFTFDAALPFVPCNKNVYDGYLSSGRPRSSGEIKFEKWCQTCSEVNWFYRNGDKGDEYFSIVYQDNGGKQKLFYPDYIVSISGKTWLIEVKGNFNLSGTSENIDIYAAKKAETLGKYCKKHKIRGGIVCYNEQIDELTIASNGNFSEEPSNHCWRSINEAIKE